MPTATAPAPAPNSRLALVRTLLDAEGLDAYLALNTPDIRWLTGWTQLFDDEQAHAALITPTAAHLHSDTRYSNAMRARNEDASWLITSDPIKLTEFVTRTLSRGEEPSPVPEKSLPNSTGQPSPAAAAPNKQPRLGIEATIALNRYRALQTGLEKTCELVEKDGLLHKLRSVKDANEIALIKRAQAITDVAFTHMLAWLKPGQTELEAANELEHFMRAHGAEGLAFSSIIASGPNSANPHAIPSGRRFERGDFVVMDFGARYHDYCSDMTRTVVFGTPTREQRAIYAAVLDAHEAAKAALKPGMTGKEANQVAVDVIAAAGYGEYFTHSLGHGVGIEVHEAPNLAQRSEDTLATGNIVTVEPGIYLPGTGGVRIEDFGALTAKGFEDFTTSPHELMVL
jgi:Xaa-Pro aminopeptidase